MHKRKPQEEVYVHQLHLFAAQLIVSSLKDLETMVLAVEDFMMLQMVVHREVGEATSQGLFLCTLIWFKLF